MLNVAHSRLGVVCCICKVKYRLSLCILVKFKEVFKLTILDPNRLRLQNFVKKNPFYYRFGSRIINIDRYLLEFDQNAKRQPVYFVISAKASFCVLFVTASPDDDDAVDTNLEATYLD